ncbi:MAG: hypothetical protein Q7R32_08140 [Dehalococcoidia bacterium]|nr:hypothetical protein [Dehalococcoidia bacterium]
MRSSAGDDRDLDTWNDGFCEGPDSCDCCGEAIPAGHMWCLDCIWKPSLKSGALIAEEMR